LQALAFPGRKLLAIVVAQDPKGNLDSFAQDRIFTRVTCMLNLGIAGFESVSVGYPYAISTPSLR
jgi:hypothetical protein